MTRPFVLPGTKRRRGSPNWVSRASLPILVTEFERQVEQLGRAKAQYTSSAQLKLWCEHNLIEDPTRDSACP
jgi:hypothetical protein